MNYATSYAPPIALDLYEIAKAKAWRGMWIGLGMFFGGLVLGIAGAVTGFLIIVALLLVVGGLVKFCTGLALASDPTKRLIHLGVNQIMRREAFRVAEQDFADPRTFRIQTFSGGGLVSASWFAYHDKEQLILVRREDIIWSYVVQKKRQRNIRIQIRTGLVMELDDVAASEMQILQAIQYAAPCALSGYDLRFASLPIQALAYEVDRRRAYGMPAGY